MSDGILFLLDLVFLAGILTGCLLAASYELRREREQQAYFDHLLARALANPDDSGFPILDSRIQVDPILRQELADPDLAEWERELQS